MSSRIQHCLIAGNIAANLCVHDAQLHGRVDVVKNVFGCTNSSEAL